MSKPKSNRNFSEGVISRVVSSGMHFVVSALLLLTIHSGVHAQHSLSQSRFITGLGPFSQTCSVGGGTSASDCMPDVNGVVHMRFDPDTVQVDDNGTAGNTDDDRLLFTIQVRKTGSELPYSVGGLGIDYNSAAFGQNLNTSASGEQCTYTKGAIIDNANYGLTMVDTAPSLLSVFAIATDFTSTLATSNSFSVINDEWQDLLSFSCRIKFDADGSGSIDANEGTMDAEAGLAFSARLWAENQVWIAGTGDATTLNRTVFGVADNDLRGFRLDGKTWVEDYARHDDGKGVRLKFSKGVAVYNAGSTTPTALTAANFSLESASDAVNITNVTHVPNEPYINVRFQSAISNGILKLVSSATSTVKDSDDNDLANDNFVAALAHDADAPYATGISRVAYRSTDGIGRSEWEVSFSKPLNPATVLKENLCLTGADGLCAPAVGSATTLSIFSVEINGANTTLTLVINEGRVKQAKTLSLEFKRNAVLGADFKVVEDYQTALRDGIELRDGISPTITVEAQGTAVPLDGYRYRVSFTVRSDEDANIDGSGNLYHLAGVNKDDSLIPQTGLTADREMSGVFKKSVDISYTITFPTNFSFDELQGLKGFTLLRGADGSLSDSAGNGPIRGDGSEILVFDSNLPEGSRIDLSDGAIVLRADTDPPRLTLGKVGDAVPNAENSLLYTGQFTIGANEAIADLGDPGSYSLLRKPIGNDLEEINSTITQVSVSNDQQTATLRYEVKLGDIATVLQTEGFTLARGNNPQYLLDNDYNFPVRDTASSDAIEVGTAINPGVISARRTDAPTIRVQAINLRADVDPHPNRETIYPHKALPDQKDGNRYKIRFAVKADRPISNIADINSYTLIANPIDSNRPIGASSMTVIFSETPQVSSDGSATTLTYSVKLDSVDVTQRIDSFTLGRGSNGALLDRYGNGLAIDVGNALDTAPRAIADRDTTPPQLSVSKFNNFYTENGYIFQFLTGSSESGIGVIRGRRDLGSYKLLRKRRNGKYAITGFEPDNVQNQSGSNFIVTYRNVRLSEADARDTVAFVLGRGGNALRDRANNDPITVGGNGIVKPNAPLDVGSDGEVPVNMTHPSITVEPQGQVMSDANNPLMYSGRFVLSANTVVDPGIDGDNGILGLSNSDSYWLWHIPVDGSGDMPSTQTAQIMIDSVNGHSSATVSFTTVFNTPAEVMQTKGFTLARRDNLLDYASNYPVDPVNTSDEIERGERLDSREAAVALRDSGAPEYTVTTNGQLSIGPNGYTMAFNVSAPPDVSDLNLRSAQSYRLLRKLNGDTYEPIAGILAEDIAQGGNITVHYVDVPLLSIDDARLTEGFTLGRSEGSLRDLANNDPVVQIGRSTTEVTVIPALPLDAKAAALFTIERERPSLTVQPSDEVRKIGTRYIGNFNLSSDEGIDGIESTASYVLLRVPQRSNRSDPPGTPVVMLADASLSVGSVNFNTMTSATVSFDVIDSGATSKHSFTLGRADRLSDLVGNPLVDPAPTRQSGDSDSIVATSERIDSRFDAEAQIPEADTPNPIINVVATDGLATADENNPLVYRGSFTVSADRAVSGIGYGGSYKLLRIGSEGSHVEATATIGASSGATTADALAQMATITFSTTLTSVTALAETFGFTLGYADNLEDNEGVLPLFYANRADRLDINSAAVAEINIPLQITAKAVVDEYNPLVSGNLVRRKFNAYPSFNRSNLRINGNEYMVSFSVRSMNGQPIPGINSTSSYVLLHIPTSGDPIDLTRYIVFNRVNPSGREIRAWVEYTVKFGEDTDDDALALTHRTAGFVLGRAPGELQETVAPLDSAGAPIADGARIDPSEGAIARRDTISPVISVEKAENNSLSADGFLFDFNLRTTNDEYLKAQWNSAEDFVILRKRDTDPVEYERIEGLRLSSLPLSTLSNRQRINSTMPFRLSEDEAKETLGFTVGYNNESPLRDIANNPVYIRGTNRAQSVEKGKAFDIRNAALVMRDMEPPSIEVTAQGLMPVASSGGSDTPKYSITFNVAAENVIALSSTASYQLLRKLENSNYETVGVEKLDLLSANAISTTQAQITFGSVALTVDEIQETLSFTLGRAPNDPSDRNDCPLCDYASNAPTAVAGGPLDTRPEAEAMLADKTGPQITVIAIGTATPNATNPPNSYSGSFEVRSNEPVLNLNEVSSYALLRVPLMEDRRSAGEAVPLATTAALALVPVNATRLTITFNVDLGNLTSTQKTYGFTLGRASGDPNDPNDCKLCDTALNPPIDRNGMEIGDGERLDSTATAIVRRDIDSPSITVSPVGSLDIRPNYYAMTFRVTAPTDVADSELRSVSSYQLLRKLTAAAGGEYEAISSAVLSQPIASSGNIDLVYGNISPLSITEISETESFTLGLGIEGRLRDASGNDLVILGSDEKVTVDPRQPLDSRGGAHLTVERVSPQITVRANSLIRSDNDYTGSFSLSSGESIDGIASSASYVLLRVPKRANASDPPGAPAMVLSNANLSVSNADLVNLRNAIIHFNVSDSAATSMHRFTLGRATRLSDLSGNPLVDDSNSIVAPPERIDSRVDAEAQIPEADTDNPIIRVMALGNAVANENNSSLYTGSFRVSSNEMVSGLSDIGSYKLLRIHIDGSTPTEITATITAIDTSQTTATITFSTTLTTAETLQTLGFTLGYEANLIDDDSNPPVLASGGRLDANSDAIARISRPLEITAKAIVDTANNLVRLGISDTIKAYPEVNFNEGSANGNQYSMIFRVRSGTGEAIPGIGSTSTYKLLHIPTSGMAIGDLSSYIVSDEVQKISDSEARVRYIVEFGTNDNPDAITLTRRTAGFVLGHADGTRIDPSDGAIARRDTVSPKINVINNSTLSADGFRFNFTARTEPLEHLQAQWSNLRAFRILRKRNNGYTPIEGLRTDLIIITGIEQQISVITNHRHPFRLSENEAKETLGFTLGYNNSSSLRDLANNPVYIGGSDSAQLVEKGKPFDLSDDALMVRDANPPFMEVTAEEFSFSARAIPTVYNITFRVIAKQLDAEQNEIDATDIMISNSSSAYQLLYELEDGTFVSIPVGDGLEGPSPPTVNVISSTQVTIFYRNASVRSGLVGNVVGFALGRAPNEPSDRNDCKLCDYASNAPVVAGTTRTAMAGEPLDPRDAAQAKIPTFAPLAEVLPPTAMAKPSLDNGNEYTMRFKVSYNQPIIGGLGNLDAYSLIHLPTTGTALSNDELEKFIFDRSISSTNNEVTMHYEVTLDYTVKFVEDDDVTALALTQRTKGFGLTGNPGLHNGLGYRAFRKFAFDTQIEAMTIISAGYPIDNNAVAYRDTEPPSIAITPMGEGAIREDIDSNIYSMRFSVTVVNDEPVRGFEDAASYTLLEVPTSGSPQIQSGTVTTSTAAGALVVAYDDVKSSDNATNPTIGFTLGRNDSSLRDLSNNDPVDANNAAEKIDSGLEELDSRESAIAKLIRGILLRVKVILEGPFR